MEVRSGEKGVGGVDGKRRGGIGGDGGAGNGEEGCIRGGGFEGGGAQVAKGVAEGFVERRRIDAGGGGGGANAGEQPRGAAPHGGFGGFRWPVRCLLLCMFSLLSGERERDVSQEQRKRETLQIASTRVNLNETNLSEYFPFSSIPV